MIKSLQSVEFVKMNNGRRLFFSSIEYGSKRSRFEEETTVFQIKTI